MSWAVPQTVPLTEYMQFATDRTVASRSWLQPDRRCPVRSSEPPQCTYRGACCTTPELHGAVQDQMSPRLASDRPRPHVPFPVKCRVRGLPLATRSSASRDHGRCRPCKAHPLANDVHEEVDVQR